MKETSHPGTGETLQSLRIHMAEWQDRVRRLEERLRRLEERSSSSDADDPIRAPLRETMVVRGRRDGSDQPVAATEPGADDRAASAGEGASAATPPSPAASKGMPELLRPAPGFDLPATTGDGETEIRAALDDYAGRWLVLVFYPKDFSFVCPTELQALSLRLDEFAQMNCSVLAVGGDDLVQHVRWIQTPTDQGGVGVLGYPLASDRDGSMARDYGVWNTETGGCHRGLFIIDPEGVIQYQSAHNPRVGRGANEILRTLAALQTGGLCAGPWAQGEQPLDLAQELRNRKMLSSYQLLEEIGSGAFGVVFKARDLGLDRVVALKVLMPERLTSANSIIREARSAAALNHPNICTIHAADDSAGTPIIAMEYIEGETLQDELSRGPLTQERAMQIARQIAQGLAAAHRGSITHGDLKPANIMITPGGRAKILDFGLAQLDVAALDPEATRDLELAGGTISGTPAYMSPEQAQGKPRGCPSDIFAFGLLLAELFTGERVVRGRSVSEWLWAVCHIDAESVASRVPPVVRDIVRRALVLEADERDIRAEEIVRLLG